MLTRPLQASCLTISLLLSSTFAVAQQNTGDLIDKKIKAAENQMDSQLKAAKERVVEQRAPRPGRPARGDVDDRRGHALEHRCEARQRLPLDDVGQGRGTGAPRCERDDDAREHDGDEEPRGRHEPRGRRGRHGARCRASHRGFHRTERAAHDRSRRMPLSRTDARAGCPNRGVTRSGYLTENLPIERLRVVRRVVVRCPVERRRHQLPVFSMLFHGSAGSFESPFCRSSNEIPSGDLTNAMWPSRGGRLIVTPPSCSFRQVA